MYVYISSRRCAESAKALGIQRADYIPRPRAFLIYVKAENQAARERLFHGGIWPSVYCPTDGVFNVPSAGYSNARLPEVIGFKISTIAQGGNFHVRSS